MKTISLDEMGVQQMTHKEIMEVDGGCFLLILGISILIGVILEASC